MTKEDIRAYCMKKKGAIEDQPFSTPVPVFKVSDKMFALLNIHEDRPSVNLKYRKDSIEALRQMHEEIIPGYHMNKSWWNTIYLDGQLEDALIMDLIDTSYELVFNSLTKKKQKAVNEIESNG